MNSRQKLSLPIRASAARSTWRSNVSVGFRMAESMPARAYDGFMSYSHAADDLLAPRLQSALQRFAKPWWRRRAVRIFRDESSLSANPHLWSSITEALDTSGWFVLLLSPDAAQSDWVNQEISYWVEHRDPKKILPVVTDGSFGWAEGDVSGEAVPPALRGVAEVPPVDARPDEDEVVRGVLACLVEGLLQLRGAADPEHLPHGGRGGEEKRQEKGQRRPRRPPHRLPPCREGRRAVSPTSCGSRCT